MSDNKALTKTEQAPLAQRDTAATQAMSAARAEVEARYLVAMRNPRIEDQVREKLLKECRRPSFAKFNDPGDPGGALYKLPFGTTVTDFSVRFMEAAARCWGNLNIESHVVTEDERRRVVRVIVSDLETNLHHTAEGVVEKTVERHSPGDRRILSTRTNSSGENVYVLEANEREMRQSTNAEISKCLRTAVKRHIPGWLLDECREVIEETMKKGAAEDPDAWGRKLVDSFGALNVPASELHKFLGHDLGTSSPEELVELREIYAAIRDGVTTWHECLAAKTGVATDAKKDENLPLKERLREKRRKAGKLNKKRQDEATTSAPADAAGGQAEAQKPAEGTSATPATPPAQEEKKPPQENDSGGGQQTSLPVGEELKQQTLSPDEWERRGERGP